MADADQQLTAALTDFETSGAARSLRHHRYRIAAPWQATGEQHLHGIYLLHRDNGRTRIRAFATDRDVTLPEADPGAEENIFSALAQQHQAATIDFDAPALLGPVAVRKPWGQELWYTGIERRGLSNVLAAAGSTPLPWVLSLAPQRLSQSKPLTLLKVLDPLPEPLFGDLYLELHDLKQEIYVVTHVDRGAWPNGVGAIRHGIDPDVRRRYDHDSALRKDFLKAVSDYERVRREIDEIFDGHRLREGIDADMPVTPELMKRWHAALPPALANAEKQRRRSMDHFTALRPIGVGDVVAVRTGTPHSLQHGVRAVEFQTPVYERRIIAFGQKVLTQDHWDSAEAISRMTLDPPDLPGLDVVVDDDGRTIEQIAAFDEFTVWRARLAERGSIQLPPGLPYAICFVIHGEVQVGTVEVHTEHACWLPHAALHRAIVNSGNGTALCLIAAPGL